MKKRLTYGLLFFALIVLGFESGIAQSARSEFKSEMDKTLNILKENPDEAIKSGIRTYQIAKENEDRWAMAVGKSLMGYISYRVKDYETAFINYTDALNSLQQLDSVDLDNEISVLRHLATISSKFNNHDQSILYRKEALDRVKTYSREYPELAIEKGINKQLRDIPYFLAVEYEKKGAHQTAGKILMDLWERAENQNDIVTHARVLNRLGLIKKANGEYNEALEYFGLVASEPTVSEKKKAIAYQNLGETYLKQGELERAERYLLLALNAKEQLNNPRSTFIAYLYLGELEYQKNEMGKAINLWEQGLNVFDKVEGEPELYNVYNKLQLAYMDIDIAKAKSLNQEFNKLNDFYVRNQTFQRGEESSRREALSALIDQEKQRRLDAQQRQEFIRTFWPVFLGVGLLVLFSVILGIRYYVALRANRALSQTQLKLERAKEILKSAETDLD